MLRQNHKFTRYIVPAVFALLIVCLGVSMAPSASLAHPGLSLAKNFGPQDATPPAAAAPAQAPATPAKKELPDGDGKAIATASCQACHTLTNIMNAHKTLDEWRETVQTMLVRGAEIPDEKVEPLVQYLARNFGPRSAAPPPAAAPSAGAPAAAPSQAAKPELPDGDGKATATASCQSCHSLTNIIRAHKTLDEWRETVQTMLVRGADVSDDKVEPLVQYLAKNFGPRPANPPAGAAPPAEAK